MEHGFRDADRRRKIQHDHRVPMRRANGVEIKEDSHLH
jgi:hypothetical protein